VDLVRRLARAKLRGGRANDPEALVVAADTVVALDVAPDMPGKLPAGASQCGADCIVLGKPQDSQDAIEMLRLLRDRAHQVFTGLSVASGNREVIQVAKTTVWMRDYTDTEIEAYVRTGDPLDKAAAYAIQNHAFHPVSHIEGCYANVMGLPLCHLYQAFKILGISVGPPARLCQDHLETECPVTQEIINHVSGYSV
jgi:predicted house-cleaning NTP pyrophosphatase (Maf/HAM1 superfamily)